MENSEEEKKVEEIVKKVLCNDFGYCSTGMEPDVQEKEQIKKEQEQDDNREIPPFKVGGTVVQCDWRTKECKVLKSDGTPIEVGSDENWKGFLDGDTIKSVRRKKSDNDIK